MSVYDLTREYINYDMLRIGDIINVPYSGIAQTIELPPGEYKLEVWGAQGGDAYWSTTGPKSTTSGYAELTPYTNRGYPAQAYGGKGGYSKGNITLKNYTTLFCYAGGYNIGWYTAAYYDVKIQQNKAGFNGGGHSLYTDGKRTSGGGGSDIRIGQDSLYARVIVAGGGSSAEGNENYRFSYYLQNGFHGGGLTGGGNTPGTQTSAGVNGGFGYAADNADGYNGNHWYGWFTTNSGGGWYGGGWGPTGSAVMSSGGGSGYVYTSETAVNYPSGCLLNSDYYLTNAETIGGNQSITEPDGTTATGHSGYGYCRITVIKVYNLSYIYAKNETQKQMVSATISTPPTTTSYSNGSRFNPTGIQLTVTYDDNTTETITPVFKTSDMPILSTGQTSVKLCYTCNEYGVVLTQAITVS